jgi:hypothetical protein
MYDIRSSRKYLSSRQSLCIVCNWEKRIKIWVCWPEYQQAYFGDAFAVEDERLSARHAFLFHSSQFPSKSTPKTTCAGCPAKCTSQKATLHSQGSNRWDETPYYSAGNHWSEDSTNLMEWVGSSCHFLAEEHDGEVSSGSSTHLVPQGSPYGVQMLPTRHKIRSWLINGRSCKRGHRYLGKF